jgi:hypothetical protein
MLLLFAIPLTTLLVYALVGAVVIAVLYWLITTFVPAPAQKFFIAALVVIAVIILIKLVFQFAGGGEPAI